VGKFVNFCAGAKIDILPAERLGALLVNVPQYAASEADVRGTRKMIEVTLPEYTAVDLGGFQFLQGMLKGGRISCDPSRPIICNEDEVNAHPSLVIEAVLKLRPHIDMLISLDLPVPKISDPHLQYVEFKRKLGFNLTWMRETTRLGEKHCPEIERFVPIQCYDLGQFTDYIEKPLLDLKFHGLSLPTRNLDPGGITLFLLKFYQMGIRKVHLLSVSNLTGLALAAYWARHFSDWCSVDATTWRLLADKQIYMDPFDLHPIFIGQGTLFPEGLAIRCDCPWCAGKTFTGIKNTPMTDRTSVLRCHNYYVIQKAGKEFYENAGDLVTLERCLKRRTTRQRKKIDRLIYALSVADCMRDADIKDLESLLWKG